MNNYTFKNLKRYAKLANEAYENYNPTELKNGETIFSYKSGFYATLRYDETSGEKILAIRGTEELISNDVISDIFITLGFNSPQYISLMNVIEELREKNERNLTVIGHSLGGSLTQFAMIYAPDIFSKAVTFNTLGSLKEFKDLNLSDNLIKKGINHAKNNTVNVILENGATFVPNIGKIYGEKLNISGFSHKIKNVIEILDSYSKIEDGKVMSREDIVKHFNYNFPPNGVVEKIESFENFSVLDYINKIDYQLSKLIKEGEEYTAKLIYGKEILNIDKNSAADIYALLLFSPIAISSKLTKEKEIEIENNINEYTDQFIELVREVYILEVKDENRTWGVINKEAEIYRNLLTKYRLLGIGTNKDDVIDAQQFTRANIFTFAGNDVIYAAERINYIESGSGNDYIFLNPSNRNTFILDSSGDDVYYLRNNTILQDLDGKGKIYLNNMLLTGGKYDHSSGRYFDTFSNMRYTFDGNDLWVRYMYDLTELRIKNFKNKDLGIDLIIEKMAKQVVIVIDTTASMQDDLKAVINNAHIIANNIFNSDLLASISIITYADTRINHLGTAYSYNDFTQLAAKLNTWAIGDTENTMSAILTAINSFDLTAKSVKDIYVMTDEPGDDNHLKGQVIALANEHKINIHSVVINHNAEDLKEVSDKTFSHFIKTETRDDLDNSLFNLSKLGSNQDDYIIGNENDNIIAGRAGNDILHGGLGDDIYIYYLGDNSDIIYDESGNDKLVFKNLIKDNISYSIKNNDLIFHINDYNDTITIQDHFSLNSKLEVIEFADKEVLDLNDNEVSLLALNKYENGNFSLIG